MGLFDESLPVCEDYDLWLRIPCRYPVLFIEKPLIVKKGGHADQLSRRYEAMDRFRIESLTRLLKSGLLSEQMRGTALLELGNKCRIYALGAKKRDKAEEAEYYLSLPEQFQ